MASLTRDLAPAREHPVRWFGALDPHTAPPGETRAFAAAAPFFIAALIAVALVRSAVMRAMLPVTLALAAVLVFMRARRGERRASDKPRRGLALEHDRLVFHEGEHEKFILLTAAPFGVTLLAPPDRDRVVALISSTLGTYYIGAHLDVASRRALDRLFERVVTVSPEEAALDAIGPDGEPLFIAPAELAALVDALVIANPSCLERFNLTDARGAALTLDNRALRIGDRAIDLTAPLEWRSILFQESFGQALALYQGTWIRQGSTELVLVALLPSTGPVFGADLDLASTDRSVLRDLRLMQGTPEEPPPSDQRVAVDRLFMLPIRWALERAPRPAQRSSRASA